MIVTEIKEIEDILIQKATKRRIFILQDHPTISILTVIIGIEIKMEIGIERHILTGKMEVEDE